MKKIHLLTTFVVLPTLALAACTGLPAQSSSSLGSQAASLVKGVAAQTAAQTASKSITNQSYVLGQTSATTPTGTSTFQDMFESIYQSVSPSVVNIDVIESATSTGSSSRSNPFGRSPSANAPVAQALGSGFVWDKLGHIVTNNHVINGASSITVTFSDGTSVPAKVVGADPNADLAVIQVSAPANLLVPVTVGDTAAVKVGEIAIAIGNPFGLQGTMTQGIISGLERTLPTNLDSTTAQTGPTYNIPDIIQTDAPINPGNSGGVLVDTTGSLIGVTAAIESNSNSSAGIGFVIPSEIVQKVVPVLISTGMYKHPYLGLSGTDLNPDLAKAMSLDPTTRGALVIDVTTGGPSAKAGLLASTQSVTINGQSANVGGDVITAIDGNAVRSFDDLGSYLFVHTDAGQTVTLTVLRQGKSTQVKVTTGVLP